MKPSVAGVEQVEDFDARLAWREVLKGRVKIPCSGVFPFAEAGREDENLFQALGRGLNRCTCE